MDINDGLIGYWPLGVQSYDATTKQLTDDGLYSNHGTSANDASHTTNRTGGSGGAILLNGSSDSIDCGTGDSLDITSEITISVWVKPEAVSGYVTSYRTFVSKGEYPSLAYGLYWNSSSNHLTLILNNNAIKTESIYSYSDRVGLWTHIVATYDGAHLKTYANGVQVGSSVSYIAAIGTDLDHLLIGWAGSDRYFKGSMADLRIYNRAILQDEITWLYLEQKRAYSEIRSLGALEEPVRILGNRSLIV